MLAWILLAVGIVLVALTALYVAAEFALVTVDRAAVDDAAMAGDRTAGLVQRGLRSLSSQLSGAQIGITVTTLALGYVMEPSLAALLTGPLQSVGLPRVAASTVAVVVALVVATVASMVLGELVPKNLALARPLAVARGIIRFNSVTTTVARPLIWALNGTANAVVRLIGMEPQEELRAARTASELGSLVRRSGVTGRIDRRSAHLVEQSLRFSSKCADDVLTPRVDMVAVHAGESASDIIDLAARSGYSRFPVIDHTIDDVVGLVHVKRAVAVPRDMRDVVLARTIMVEAPRVPGTLPLDDLLLVLRRRGFQMAVVADEYGGTAGLVTLEDAVEELVGEIADEHDQADDRCTRRPDGTVLVSGALRPDEIADLTGLRLPEPEEYDTLAGLLLERLDHVPVVGDSVVVGAELDADAGLGALGDDAAIDVDPSSDIPRPVLARLTVRRMSGRRVIGVVLSAAGASATTEFADGDGRGLPEAEE